MIKVAIFTAGYAGSKILNILKLIENIEIVCFVDNNANLYGKRIDGLQIVSAYRLKKLVEEGNIDCVLVPSNRLISYGLREYIVQLDELGIDNYKIIPSYTIRKKDIDINDVKKVEEIIFYGEFKKINQLQHLQFHIVDNCNLNCRRCQHFSNIAEKKSFADFKEIKKDFDRLEELFDDINTIAILGGEPLLNPELPQYCTMVREHFQNAQIEVITNGLLVKQMSNELIQAIKQNNIFINISYYPVLKPTIESIISFLTKNNIHFVVGSEIKYFSKRLCENNSMINREEIFKTCRDGCCTTLRNGKIYPCYLPATIHLFNKKFNKNIECGKSYIDIYDTSLSGIDIVERLKQSFDICAHCGKEKIYVWEQVNIAEEKDWLIE